MRQHSTDREATRRELTELQTRYGVERARVDQAYRRIREIEVGCHAPAAARTASSELNAAVRGATDTAAEVLQLLVGQPSGPHRRLRRRPKVTRSVPADVATWSAELARLSQVAVWLRRASLDDLGVHVPTTVRVADYAANRPHIPGLDFGNQPPDDGRRQRIGIDLQAGVDAPAVPVVTHPVNEQAAAASRAA